MMDGICDWYTQGIKLPEFTPLPVMFKKMQIANCEFAQNTIVYLPNRIGLLTSSLWPQKNISVISSPKKIKTDATVKMMPSILILWLIFIVRKLFGIWFRPGSNRAQPSADYPPDIRRLIKNLTCRKHISDCSNGLINKSR